MNNNLNLKSNTTCFSKELRPRRSSSPQTAGWLVIVSIVLVVLIGLIFVYIGAWPVFGFLGLELITLNALVFYHYQQGFIVEHIVITENNLSVVRTASSGQKHTWTAKRHWLQVNLQAKDSKSSQLELRSHGRAIFIGSFLTPSERLNLATWLRDALNSIGPPISK